MKRIIIALSAALAATAIAMAGPVEDREALMKERAGLAGQISKMAKGDTAFDAAAALDLLQKVQANADLASAEIAALWGPGTEGGKTGPKVYEDQAGFKAATDQFKADVDAAVANPPTDAATLQASFGAVAKNCSTCHQLYRVQK